VNARVEGASRPAQAVNRQSRSDVGRPGERFRAVEREGEDRGRSLRAVDERETLNEPKPVSTS